MSKVSESAPSRAAHRFNNDLRYRGNDHVRQRLLTPPYLLEPIRAALGGVIDLDPCTEPDNPTAAMRFFTADDDGLAQAWDADTIFVNPPYSRAREPWIARCMEASGAGSRVVALIPAHTDTRLVQRCLDTASTVCFIRGRVKFGVPRANGRQEAASHPSAVFGWNVDLFPLREQGIVVGLNGRAHVGVLREAHGS